MSSGPERLLGLRDERLGVRALREVGGDRLDPDAARAQLVGELVEEGGVRQVGEHEVDALGGERAGDRVAEAAGGAGDERVRPLKLLHRAAQPTGKRRARRAAGPS